MPKKGVIFCKNDKFLDIISASIVPLCGVDIVVILLIHPLVLCFNKSESSLGLLYSNIYSSIRAVWPPWLWAII